MDNLSSQHGWIISRESWIITTDIVTILAKFLNPIDIINVCKAYPPNYKKLYPAYKASVARKIDNWFRNYFSDNDYILFRSCMIVDSAILTGSFILQIMLGEVWVGSDIDFFIGGYPINFFVKEHRKTDDLKAFKPIINRFFKNHSTKITSYQTHGYKHCKFMPGKIDVINSYPTKFDSETEPNPFTKFQTILLDCTMIPEKVISIIDGDFDLDVCKNTFHYTDYTETGYELRIPHIGKVLNKTCNIIGEQWLSSERKRNRYAKYEARGFTFPNSQYNRRLIHSIPHSIVTMTIDSADINKNNNDEIKRDIEIKESVEI